MFDARVWPRRPCRSKPGIASFGMLICGLVILPPCQYAGHSETGIPAGSVLESSPSMSELENDMLSILNRDRARRGLPPLASDSPLSRIARDHSRNMAAHGKISHNLPSSGDLKTRLERAGYTVRKARENVARAGSIEDAETALLKSPGHLRNIVATDVTHVGIGIARGTVTDGSDLYITQVFADPAVPAQPAQLRKVQWNRIEEARRDSGLRPLRVDPLFDKVAARLLERLRVPFGKEELGQLLNDAQKQIPRGLVKDVSRMSLDIQLVRDIKDMKTSEELRRARASVVGLAAREFRDSRGQPVVAMLALIGSR